MSKKVMRVVAVLAVSIGLAGSASAHNRQLQQHVPPAPKTVDICHVNKVGNTWNTATPYTKQTVNAAQYVVHYLVDFRQTVPTNEVEAVQLVADHKYWGDIMPQFNGYGGRNLVVGQAILDNDCNYVAAGGSGGTTDPAPTDPATPVVAQVAAPTRKLVAAGGATPTTALVSLVGVVASIGALGYGVTKFRKV